MTREYEWNSIIYNVYCLSSVTDNMLKLISRAPQNYRLRHGADGYVITDATCHRKP